MNWKLNLYLVQISQKNQLTKKKKKLKPENHSKPPKVLQYVTVEPIDK
jgi:hypothetical protein